MAVDPNPFDRLSPKKRGQGRLPPAPGREAIPAAYSEAVPETDPGSGTGVLSPLVEQPYAGSTFLNVTSSDGLMVFEYGDETDYIDDDGNGSAIKFKHI